MKKLLMVLSFISVTTFAFSQGQSKHRQGPPTLEERLNKATKELSLTDSQVEQWTEIHEKYELPGKDRSASEATREKMGEELEATLTEEQLEKFQEMRKTRGPHQGKSAKQ